MNILRNTTVGLSAGLALLAAVSAPLSAQTELTVQNDGLTMTAGAISSDDILSITLRIVGPDGFHFEQRIEDSLIQWVPKGELADGLYSWEAMTVTVEAGAPVRLQAEAGLGQSGAFGEFSENENLTNGSQLNDDAAKASIRSAGTEDRLRGIPVERLYSNEFKSVERRSGSFLVKDGWIEPGFSGDDGVTQSERPGLIGSIAGAVIDFIFPSAHAQNFTDNVIIDKNDPALIFDSAISTPQNWRIQGSTSAWTFRDVVNGTIPFWISPGTNNGAALRIDANGFIGMGTTAPTETLHISSNRTEIRLENTLQSQSWYVKNSNVGRFEIGEATEFSGAFVIQPGAPGSSIAIGSNGNVGIGTDSPADPLTVLSDSTFVPIRFGTNAGDQYRLFASSSGHAVLAGVGQGSPFKVALDSTTDSLVVANQAVGIGTASPASTLSVEQFDDAQISAENTTSTQGQRVMLSLANAGKVRFLLENKGNSTWSFDNSGPSFDISRIGTGVAEFRVFSNGNALFQGDVTANGVVLSSSRALKTDFKDVEELDILDKVSALDIMEWRYKKENEGTSHIGPMAEEFQQVFGLGDGKTLNMVDTTGITFAAIQGLREEQRDRLAALEQENAKLRARLSEIDAIKAQLAELSASR